MKPNTLSKMWIILAPLSFLLGCTNSPVREAQGASSGVRTVSNVPAACLVKVIQDGKPAKSDAMAGVTRYLLKGGSFRLEVSDVLCDPSIGVFTKPTDFFYVAGSSAIATTAMFSMAGDTASGAVLIVRSEDPRVPPSEDLFDSTESKDKYKAACTQLGKCPLKIRAYRSYWPFASDDQGSRRTFAEFRYLFEKRPLDGFKGDVPVVVYTKVVPKITTREEQNAYFQLFAIQPFILHFE